jgi:hypothetical protein
MIAKDKQYDYLYGFMREWIKRGETAAVRSIFEGKYG